MRRTCQISSAVLIYARSPAALILGLAVDGISIRKSEKRSNWAEKRDSIDEREWKRTARLMENALHMKKSIHSLKQAKITRKKF